MEKSTHYSTLLLDNNCLSAVAILFSKTRDYIRRYPKDPVVRGRYNKLKKQYKTLIRTKKRMFRESILMKIQNLESRDPKEFWKLVKEEFWKLVKDLRERKRNNLSDNIDLV